MRLVWILLLSLLMLVARVAQEVKANPMSASKGGGHVIQDESTNLTQQPTLRFTGAGVTCVDAPPVTACTIAGAAGGAPSFLDLTTGTNTAAAMTCGSG